MSLWKFKMVNGKASVRIMTGTLTEKEFMELRHAYEAFMEPVYRERRETENKAHTERVRAEENMEEHVEVIDGVEVWIATKGPENTPYMAWVGSPDRALARFFADRKSFCNSPMPFQVEFPTKGLWADKPYWVPLRSVKGAALSFKTLHAAIRAGIAHEKQVCRLTTEAEKVG